jgi:gamma-D-glutamyl-L-lysine dipeptidyl-peptidase
MYGICNLSIVPCRSDASDRSEIVSQLLFGEHFYILNSYNNWIYIRNAFDNYEGWIDQKQFLPVSSETFRELEEANHPLSSDLVQLIIHKESKDILPIVMGSVLPFFDGTTCNLEGHEYLYEGQALTASNAPSRQQIAETAYNYLNTPYLWGGKSPFGIDCSGFSQMVYRFNGIKVPRDAYQQAELGETLNFVEEAREGDLAFFDNAEGRIIHVGIVLSNNHIIHASGKVRIDPYDHYGIFNSDTKKYSHNLRLLKNVIGD